WFQGIGDPGEMRSRSTMRVNPPPAEGRPYAGRSPEVGGPRDSTSDGRSEPYRKAVQLSLDLTVKGPISGERGVGSRSLDTDEHIESRRILATARSAGDIIEKEPRSGQPREDPFRMSFASILDHKGRGQPSSVRPKYGSKVRLRGQAA